MSSSPQPCHLSRHSFVQAHWEQLGLLSQTAGCRSAERMNASAYGTHLLQQHGEVATRNRACGTTAQAEQFLGTSTRTSPEKDSGSSTSPLENQEGISGLSHTPLQWLAQHWYPNGQCRGPCVYPAPSGQSYPAPTATPSLADTASLPAPGPAMTGCHVPSTPVWLLPSLTPQAASRVTGGAPTQAPRVPFPSTQLHCTGCSVPGASLPSAATNEV